MRERGTGSGRIRLRKFSACALAVLLLYGSTAAAEETLPEALPQNITAAEHLVIDDQCHELSFYSVTFRNTRSYMPEAFNPGKVVAADGSLTCGGPEFCRYEDGSTLMIPDSTSLVYGNADGGRYRQLLAYMDDTDAVPEAAEAEFCSLEEALERCDTLLSGLNVGSLALDRAYALPSSTIRSLTAEMRNFYDGERKPECFESFPDRISAWCMIYRQELNGIRSAGAPQVRIVLTPEGTALLELNRIIDHVNDDYQLTAGFSWHNAMSVFSAAHGRNGLGAESFEISRIRIAYDYEFLGPDDINTLDARIFPCWQIEGREAIMPAEGTGARGSGIRFVRFSERYSIGDGVRNIAW